MWEYKGGVGGLREWGEDFARIDKRLDNKELRFREESKSVRVGIKRGSRVRIKVIWFGVRKRKVIFGWPF